MAPVPMEDPLSIYSPSDDDGDDDDDGNDGNDDDDNDSDDSDDGDDDNDDMNYDCFSRMYGRLDTVLHT
jgi:hypothetical protein